MKISLLLFVLILILTGCEKKTETEERLFLEKEIEVMDTKNNPIPKHLYTLPMIDSFK